MSRAIPAHALATARRTLTSLQSDTLDVYRQTRTRGASGSTKTTWPATATVTGVACRVESVSDQRRMGDLERYGDATHVIYLAHNANLQEGDKIVTAGKTMSIVGLNDQQSERFVLEALAKEHE